MMRYKWKTLQDNKAKN